MKNEFLLIFFFCLAFLQIHESQQTEANIFQYRVLNETNFDQYKQDYNNLLVYFTASWNSESPERKAIIENLIHQLQDLTKNEKENYFAFGEVDSKNYKIFHEYDVQRYPSLILVEGSKHMKYKGDFEVTKIITWLKHLLLKQIIKLDCYQDILNTTKNHSQIVLFYGDAQNNNNQYSLYYNMTGRFQDLHFYHITNSSILKHINTTASIKDPSVIIMKEYDEKVNVFEGPFLESNLEDFIRIYSRPVLSPLNSDSYMYIMNEKKTFIALLVEEDEDEINQVLEERFYQNCLKYRSKIIGFFGDMYTTLTNEFNIKKAELPVMLIEEFVEGNVIRRFKSVHNDLQGDGMDKFFENYFSGNLILNEGSLKKYLKSEKVPEGQIIRENNIYRLVGDNFENFISNQDKWIIVFFTRKKCSMCDEGFKLLSDEYSSLLDIQFAVIDGELNELENIDIRNFPMIVLFKNGSEKYKNRINFDQIASYYNIKEFMEKEVNRTGTIEIQGMSFEEWIQNNLYYTNLFNKLI